MELAQSLLALLADGQLHSGNQLAEQLNVSRAAIWKQIQRLESYGLIVNKQAGQGYRLSQPVDLYREHQFRAALSHEARESISRLDLLWTTESTSDYLLTVPPPEPGVAQVCVAEYQTGGRGRRGRRWLAPLGSGVCLSVAWTFASPPASLSCLGLAIGVAVLRAARAAGINQSKLKWPNDIVVDGSKLAGILLDVQGEASGPLRVVVGVGMNYRLSPDIIDAIIDSGGLAPASLVKGDDGAKLDRSAVAGTLVSEILAALQEFERSGFESFAAEWLAADYLRGKRVDVTTGAADVTGIADGISDDGQLLLNVNGRLERVSTGDVNVRLTG